MKKPVRRTFKVWIDKDQAALLRRDDLAVGLVSIFPPCGPCERKRAPWKGLVPATLTLSAKKKRT